MPLVEISNLVRGILRRGVQHRNRHHRRQAARDSAIEEEIESHLIAADSSRSDAACQGSTEEGHVIV